MNKKITSNQFAVLERLVESMGPDVSMVVSQFEDLATCTKQRDEWAITPLKALERMGYVERIPPVSGKLSSWRITNAGVKAVLDHTLMAA